jgi:hypothetical protein
MTVCRSSRETILLFFCFFLLFRFPRFFCTSTRTSLIHKDMKTSIILLLLYYLSPTHSTADFRLFRLGMESATNKTNLDSIEYMKKLFLLLFEVWYWNREKPVSRLGVNNFHFLVCFPFSYQKHKKNTSYLCSIKAPSYNVQKIRLKFM